MRPDRPYPVGFGRLTIRTDSTVSVNPQIPPALVARLEQGLGAPAVLTDPGDRWAYGYDNSKRQSLPGLVVLPGSHEQVTQVVRACFECRVSLTVRGRGTGTAGAAVADEGGVVLSTERLNRIITVDAANRAAIVEAGVINGELQTQAAQIGFFWPPDPTSAAYCTIGGNLGCNSAGPRALKYGTPRENTLGLRAVTGDGRTLRTGCYTTKGVVGYDLTRLLIGSEGTLAIITEATLRLTPTPTGILSMRAVYRHIGAAAEAVARIMAQPVVPRALEFMDGTCIRLVRDSVGDTIPAEAGALLIIELDGNPEAMESGMQALEAAATTPDMIEFRAARTEAELAELWAARKALSPALRRIAPKKINEDVVVPVSRIAELTARLDGLATEHRITIVSFGHAGNGNIHVNLLGDPDQPGELERLHRCLDAMFRSVLELGGTLSGEHGIGFDKRDYVGLEIEPETLDMMRRIKSQFDPAGILNPGKLFPDDAESSYLTTRS